MTGYKGNELAADYIYSRFVKYNVSRVWFEEFPVTVPLDRGANITVISSSGERYFFPAYVLYPNHVQTCTIPPEGIQGPLIYGGFGSLEEFQGKNIKDSIVVLEFNSGWRWRYALSLGAKAVIFLENEDITRFEAETKVSTVPIYFPRLFVDSNHAAQLRSLAMKGNSIAKLHSKMVWREVTSKNVLAFIKGTTKWNSTIVLMAHYDSFSVVPSLSPGASESLGIATLIELANFFVANPPVQNILLVATSGYHQGLVGSREFIQKHFNELGSNLKLAISLDLSYETSTIAVRAGLRIGTAYQYDLIVGWDILYNPIFRKIFVDYTPLITRETGKTYNIYNVRMAPNTLEPFPIWLDSEPFAIACKGGGFGLYTCSIRQYFRSPHDTVEKMLSYPASKSNIAEQIEYIYNLLYLFSLEPAIYVPLFPTRFSAQNYGFFTVRGRVWEYNITTGWYEWTHGKAIIYVTRIPTEAGAGTYQPAGGQPPTGGGQLPVGGGQVARIFTGFQTTGLSTVIMTDEDGTFEIIGAQPGSTLFVFACVIDEKTGRILYSNEMGTFRGSGQGGSYANPFIVNPPLQFGEAIIPVFKCASIFFTLAINPLNYIWGGDLTVVVNNFHSHMPPVFNGLALVGGPDVVAFVPCNESVELLPFSGGRLISTLVNASKENPMGNGYTLQNGDFLHLTNLPRYAAENLWSINEYRLSIAQRNSITFSATATMFHEWATMLLNEANNKSDLIASAHASMAAWSYEISAHSATLNLLKDAINTSVIFFLLLIPFALLSERLFFETASGTGRLKRIIFIFIVFLGALAFIHPGFSIATNTLIILIGATVVITCILSIAFLSLIHI